MLGLVFLTVFAGFLALGTWQVHRLQWKTALIARVESRVHAPPVPAPDRSNWENVSVASDEYRHVRVSGHFLHELSTPVFASTELGTGYWLLTPLRLDDGSLVLVNRGFISQKSSMATRPATEMRVTLTGLLRMSEPNGAYLRRNAPEAGKWYSRDVQAISQAKSLSSVGPVAPYFIDVDADPQDATPSMPNQPRHEPLGGLTVIHFPNNHLIYALTWYALALMTAAGGAWLLYAGSSHAPRPSSSQLP